MLKVMRSLRAESFEFTRIPVCVTEAVLSSFVSWHKMFMETLKILVTNDDGVRSPLITPFLAAIGAQPWCRDLRVVIPESEQSWIAQAATRKRQVVVTAHEFGPHGGYLAGGTPADCVSLGLDNLYADRADFVFSGINLGTNTGLPFYLSSGTVGGARQAFVSGICAAALSVKLPKNVMHAWVSGDFAAFNALAEDWHRIAAASVSVLTKLITSQAWRYADIFSINLPWESEEATEVAWTRLERRYYGKMFEPDNQGGFKHSFRGYRSSGSKSVNDRGKLRCGVISTL